MGSGNDVVFSRGTITNPVDLGTGFDTYNGTGGTVGAAVLGGADADVLIGGAGDDNLSGGSENDILSGGKGDDTLAGGSGIDVMTGGAGSDVFLFLNGAEMTTLGTPDHITDFRTKVDSIDLSFIAGGSFIGGAAFTSIAGQVRYTKATGTIEVDTSGDGLADFTLILDSLGALVATDLLF